MPGESKHEIFILAWISHSLFGHFILDWKSHPRPCFFCGQRGARNEKNIPDWKFHSVLKAWFFSIFRYRPEGVFGKGVGNSKNASEMRLVLLGKEERSKMRPKRVRNASKMRGTPLGERTPFVCFFSPNIASRDWFFFLQSWGPLGSREGQPTPKTHQPNPPTMLDLFLQMVLLRQDLKKQRVRNEPEGSKRCFLNGVFQIPTLRLAARQVASEGRKIPENISLFKQFWCLLLLRILTTLWTQHSEKHRLENTVCSSLDEKSAQRESFRPGVPADIRPKSSVRPSKSWRSMHFGKEMPRGRPTKTFSVSKIDGKMSREKCLCKPECTAVAAIQLRMRMRILTLVSHYSVIGDTIWCDAPQNAIGFRGKLFLRYPPVFGLR